MTTRSRERAILLGAAPDYMVELARIECGKRLDKMKSDARTADKRRAVSVENMRRLKIGDVFNLIVTGDEQ